MGDCCEAHVPSQDAITPQARRALWTVLWINAAMFFIEGYYGLRAGSSSLLADSLDMLSDATLYGFTLYAASRGLKTRALVSLGKGIMMAVLGIGVAGHMAREFFAQTVPAAPTMSIVAVAALAANITAALLLLSYREGDINMRSAWLCTRNDVLANLGVLAAAGGVYIFESRWPDVLIGGLIASIVLYSAYSVIQESLQLLVLREGPKGPRNKLRTDYHKEMASANAGKTASRLGNLGAALSLLCAVHCLLLPLLIVVLPLLGLSFALDERIEIALIGSALILVSGTLLAGFRQHRRYEPAILLAAGAAGIVISHFITPPSWEPGIMAASGLALAIATLVNRRHCQACQHCQADAEGEPGSCAEDQHSHH